MNDGKVKQRNKVLASGVGEGEQWWCFALIIICHFICSASQPAPQVSKLCLAFWGSVCEACSRMHAVNQLCMLRRSCSVAVMTLQAMYSLAPM